MSRQLNPARPAGRPTVITWITVAVVGAVAAAAFAAASPYFLSTANLVNLGTDAALAGIVALPATFLVMAGQVDLSVGATAAFCGVLLADRAPEWGLVPAVVAAVAVGGLIGFINGVLVTAGHITSVVATFATMGLLRGLAYLVPGGLGIVLSGFHFLGNTTTALGLTIPLLLFAGLTALAGALSRSAPGRRVRTLGAHPVADRLNRAADRRLIVLLFVVSALAAALVGLIRTSQLGTGLPTAGIGLEVTVLAAVLLGGGHLSGGHGSVIGAVLCVLAITVVDNGLSLINATPYAAQVWHAGLLVLALLLDRVRFRRPTPTTPATRGVAASPQRPAPRTPPGTPTPS